MYSFLDKMTSISSHFCPVMSTTLENIAVRDFSVMPGKNYHATFHLHTSSTPWGERPGRCNEMVIMLGLFSSVVYDMGAVNFPRNMSKLPFTTIVVWTTYSNRKWLQMYKSLVFFIVIILWFHSMPCNFQNWHSIFSNNVEVCHSLCLCKLTRICSNFYYTILLLQSHCRNMEGKVLPAVNLKQVLIQFRVCHKIYGIEFFVQIVILFSLYSFWW